MREVAGTQLTDVQQAILLPGQLPVIGGNCAEHFRKQANDANKHKPIPITPFITVYSVVLKPGIPVCFDGTVADRLS